MKKLSKTTFNNRKPLTPIQLEVLNMVMYEYMTTKQISIRRQVSTQNINQIISKIRKKGYLNKQDINTFKNQPHVKQKKQNKIWRYHALHFLIRPYYFYPRYFNIMKKSGNFGISYGDWIFKLHKDRVEVQSKSLVEFYDNNKYKAIKKGEISFNKSLLQACNRYGFKVYKEGKCNIKILTHHLAYENSDIAKGSKEDYLRIKGEDGKTWFMIDKSKGVKEHEYIKDVLPDSEKLEPYFNSLREKEFYLPHEVKGIIDTVLKIQLEHATNIKSHLRVLDQMDKTLKKIERKL